MDYIPMSTVNPANLWVLWSCVVAFVCANFGLTIGVSFYDHRYLTHHSIDITNPRLRFFCRLIAWLMTWMEPLEWAYVHRKHHIYADGERDPYSPNSPGSSFWLILLWDGPIYNKQKRLPDIIDGTYAKPWDPARDKWDELFSRTWLGAVAMGVIYLGIFTAMLQSYVALPAAGLALVVHILTVLIGAGAVNALNHDPHWLRKKARWMTYCVRDEVTGMTWNRRWLALFTAGEGWHNNHHRYQLNYRFGPYNDPTARLAEWFEYFGWVELTQERDVHDIMDELLQQKDLGLAA